MKRFVSPSPAWFAAVGFTVLAVVLALDRSVRSQDQFKVIINRGMPLVRLALADFPPQAVDERLVSLTQEFNQVLANDLDGAGIFQLVSKSDFPTRVPHQPQEVDFPSWTDAPASAQMLVFGHSEVINGSLVVYGYL